MAEFKFEPPLKLIGTPKVTVRTLDDAADYLRAYKGARRPVTQDSVLHRVEGANTTAEQLEAGKAFLGWAESEGLLIGT